MDSLDASGQEDSGQTRASETAGADGPFPARMLVRRNLLAIWLTTAGLTLLGLAVIDWLDHLWAITFHVMGR